MPAYVGACLALKISNLCLITENRQDNCYSVCMNKIIACTLPIIEKGGQITYKLKTIVQRKWSASKPEPAHAERLMQLVIKGTKRRHLSYVRIRKLASKGQKQLRKSQHMKRNC